MTKNIAIITKKKHFCILEDFLRHSNRQKVKIIHAEY